MACLGSCKICGYGVIDKKVCTECDKEIVRRCLDGEPFDENAVRVNVQARREVLAIAETKQQLEIMIDSSGRNNWEKYKKEAERLQQIIDEATSASKFYSGVPEMDYIRKILERK